MNRVHLSTHMTVEEIEEANRLWIDYVATHDLSDQTGRVAAIDPTSGDIVIADSIQEVSAIRSPNPHPALFKRISYETFYRKGGRFPAKTLRLHRAMKTP